MVERDAYSAVARAAAASAVAVAAAAVAAAQPRRVGLRADHHERAAARDVAKRSRPGRSLLPPVLQLGRGAEPRADEPPRRLRRRRRRGERRGARRGRPALDDERREVLDDVRQVSVTFEWSRESILMWHVIAYLDVRRAQQRGDRGRVRRAQRAAAVHEQHAPRAELVHWNCNYNII